MRYHKYYIFLTIVWASLIKKLVQQTCLSGNDSNTVLTSNRLILGYIGMLNWQFTSLLRLIMKYKGTWSIEEGSRTIHPSRIKKSARAHHIAGLSTKTSYLELFCVANSRIFTIELVGNTILRNVSDITYNIKKCVMCTSKNLGKAFNLHFGSQIPILTNSREKMKILWIGDEEAITVAETVLLGNLQSGDMAIARRGRRRGI